MFDRSLTSTLSSVVRAAKNASEMAPVLEDLRYKLPAGYHAPRPDDGIARPVEDILVAQEERGVTEQVDQALLGLNYAHHNLLAAVDAMAIALQRCQSPE